MATKRSQTFQGICLLEILLEQKRQSILIEEIMTQVNELAPQLQAINAQLNKAKEEIVTRIATLEAALQNVALPADAETALADVKALAQVFDDINPDAEPAPEEPVI